MVRPAVWSLSRNSAGLMIRFRSNAGRIVVRYPVAGPLNMPHMPSTGVTGVDLYAKNANGAWLWSNGRYSFGDTIVCQFNGLEPNDGFHDRGREYRLYLPLYNTVKWMEVGVADSPLFSALPVRREKPVVAYGTSIMQGACASRPGMAWVNIPGRRLDRPLINLGFSGNGMLEPEVLSLITEIDAKLYVLDCLPNLWNPKDFTREEVKKRIVSTVEQIRREPGTYDWEARHETLLALNSGKASRTVFFGNSITHYWGGEPAHKLHRGEDSWKKVFDPLGTRNFGFGWDLVENVLWRVYHDELDGFQAERVILSIGTNNLFLNTNEEILEGMELLINSIRVRQPKAEILVLGLYPRRNDETRIAALNLGYARLIAGQLAKVLQAGSKSPD